MKTTKFVLFFLIFTLFLIFVPFTYFYYRYTKITKLGEITTILVLGKGGIGHTAPNLTDTIMTISLNPSTNKTTAISLPRDIWIEDIKAKINTAYHYGGFEMAKSSTKTVIGRDVKNIVVVDFKVFKEIIDSLGGIEINVQNSFTDDRYPIAGKENDLCNGDKTYSCRYETVEFKSGKQIMNGETALKFVRSRNSQGEEGTDIAREKRQQLLLISIKNKILSPDFLFNISNIRNVYNVVVGNLETDINKDSFLIYFKYFLRSGFNVEAKNLPENLIKVSKNDKKYDFQYVFIPKNSNWIEVNSWFNNNI